MSQRRPDFWGSFPRFAFGVAYGSKALPQRRAEPRWSILDLLVAIRDDPAEWHRRNMLMNPGHYSRLARMGGADAVARMQCVPPKLHFNSMVEVQPDGTRMKYGVSTESDILDDLHQWRSLYTAGRLQKPFLLLDTEARTVLPDVALGTPSRLIRFAEAVRKNRESALVWALLQSKPNESWCDLLKRICSLSYMGDVRRHIGEAPTKVPDIVEGQMSMMSSMYMPIALQYSESHGVKLTGDFFSASAEACERATVDFNRGAEDLQAMFQGEGSRKFRGVPFERFLASEKLTIGLTGDMAQREALFDALPPEFVDRCTALSGVRRLHGLYSPRKFLAADFDRHGRPHPHDSECLVDAASRLVMKSSLVGSCKAALCAGMRKSMRYGVRKAMLAS